MNGYLNSKQRAQCSGCEACAQACPVKAVRMQEDAEGFRYPVIDKTRCIQCGLCHKVCPYENPPAHATDDKLVFGGYIKDMKVRDKSTSGGAFSAIVDAWCDDSVIFGAAAEGLNVYHTYVTDKKEVDRFRKSKYSQSMIGSSYTDVRTFLRAGRKVVFSGTPCQIAGLLAYLDQEPREKLLTIEVICEGVPTPHFVRRYDEYMQKKYNAAIEILDYRYKDMRSKDAGSRKWDFQIMYTLLKNGMSFKRDRWFNPYWSIWLEHLMSRPSCYECPYTTQERSADITLGDLWGVHLYCPELYGKNTGASLVICNTKLGRDALELAKPLMYGHELEFEQTLRYQGPLRKHIEQNPFRENFMKDVLIMDYPSICKKWSRKPSAVLLWKKYVWGNRQKVWLWNLTHRKKEEREQ